MSVKRKHYSTAHLIFDFLMVLFTGGLWLLWIFIRALRANS